jgi:hypothetical protein
MHKHLGVIFSSDCKWTKHIDVLIERTSKQLNILRKLKYKLKRDYLEKICLVFIRPILEYASLSISTSICFVHLQSLLKITPKCLCICTRDSEILLKSNSTLFSKCLVLKIIISVLLGLNFTRHLYDHAFKYSKSVLINVCKFSSKWTKHIDVLIERTSKQLNILRKLKYKLKRDYLEKICLVFIRPILEYASEVWDNCGQANCNRLEKIQIEAARIVTGLSIYASFDSIYKEKGWETLSTLKF